MQQICAKFACCCCKPPEADIPNIDIRFVINCCDSHVSECPVNFTTDLDEVDGQTTPRKIVLHTGWARRLFQCCCPRKSSSPPPAERSAMAPVAENLHITSLGQETLSDPQISDNGVGPAMAVRSGGNATMGEQERQLSLHSDCGGFTFEVCIC